MEVQILILITTELRDNNSKLKTTNNTNKMQWLWYSLPDVSSSSLHLQKVPSRRPLLNFSSKLSSISSERWEENVKNQPNIYLTGKKMTTNLLDLELHRQLGAWVYKPMLKQPFWDVSLDYFLLLLDPCYFSQPRDLQDKFNFKSQIYCSQFMLSIQLIILNYSI